MYEDRDHDTQASVEVSLRETPWILLHTSFDVEAWIDHLNRDLQRALGNKLTAGAGVRFRLTEGGDIYLHTNPDGDVLLDVTDEAAWVTPVIAAATSVTPPGSALWLLPGTLLTQLLLGMSSLIESTQLVLAHEFKRKKWSTQ